MQPKPFRLHRSASTFAAVSAENPWRNGFVTVRAETVSARYCFKPFFRADTVAARYCFIVGQPLAYLCIELHCAFSQSSLSSRVGRKAVRHRVGRLA
jgi:hypothetical protein